MRVLLTGANGFIGAHVLAALLRRGLSVAVCGRTPPPPHVHPVDFHCCNLLNSAEIAPLCEKVQASHLLHLAWGIAEPESYWTSPGNLPWFEASQVLFHHFSKAGGARIVGIGTGVEYAPVQTPRNEMLTPTLPDTVYGMAKLACCNALQLQAKVLSSSWAWARIFYLVGPRENPRRILPAACRFLKGQGDFSCWTPDARFDYLDVRDCADALVRLLLSDVAGPINIASGQGRLMRDILDELAHIAGRPGIFTYDRSLSAPVVVADAARLHGELGFSPRYGFTQSLVDCFQNVKALE